MKNVPETLFAEAEMLDKGIFPQPRTAYFTPTYKCNQRCYYCLYKDWNNKEGEEPVENIPKIFQQLREMGVQSIDIDGGGEPLVSPGIAQTIKLAADMEFRLGLLTNGTFFKDEIAETFLKYGTYVRFSLDTVDPVVYKKVRGTDDCERVIANIKNAVILREKLGSSCQISIKIAISKEIGSKEISDVFYAFEGIDINSIQVKNAWDRKGNKYRKDINKVELTRLQDGQKIPIVKKVDYPKYMSEPCWITPVQTTVDIFGDVYLCNYKMYNKGNALIGNMFETPLKELWGSQIHRDKIANIRISDCLVHDCRFQRYMKVIRRLQKSGTWSFL